MDFRPLFFALPWLFAVVYIVWKISWFVLENNALSLFSRSWIGYVLSPNGSEFHYVWVVGGALLAMILFFINKTKNHIKSMIDMFFDATMWMCFVMGIFLVFSDYVIGIPNDHGRFAVRALTEYSKVTQYGQVYPYGFVISIIALISRSITKLIQQWNNHTGLWYLGFALFALCMSFGFSYQLYDKHGVINLWWRVLDIKHYINILIMIICVIHYYKLVKTKY